ncbi:MAG: hemolysin-type calcium-binding region, partial [Alphaproteobacteria bacterium]
ADGDTVTVTGLTSTGAFTGAIGGTTGIFNITGGTGAQNITTAAGADIINGGADADTITSGAGADTITVGAGQDIIDLTEGAAAADSVIYATAFVAGNANAATITGFAHGAGADTFDVGFALAHGTLTFAAGTGGTNTIAASTPVTVADNGTTAANTGVVFLLSGVGDQMATSNATNAVANAVTAMTTTGAVADFAAANVATGDSLIVVLDDGTNSFVFHYVADATAATTAAADLELIGIINGVADAGTFATGDFI